MSARGRDVLLLAGAAGFVVAPGMASVRGREVALFLAGQGAIPAIAPWSLALAAVGVALALGLALAGLLRAREALVGGLGLVGAGIGFGAFAPTFAGLLAGRVLGNVGAGVLAAAILALAVGGLPRGRLLLVPLVGVLGRFGGEAAARLLGSGEGTHRIVGGLAAVGCLALAGVAGVVLAGDEGEAPGGEGTGTLARLVGLAGLAGAASALFVSPLLRGVKVDLFGLGLAGTGEAMRAIGLYGVPLLVVGGMLLSGVGLGRGLRLVGALVVLALAGAWMSPVVRVFLYNAGPALAGLLVSLAGLRAGAGLSGSARLAGTLGVVLAGYLGVALVWGVVSRLGAGWLTPAFVLVGVGIGGLLLWPARSGVRAAAA